MKPFVRVDDRLIHGQVLHGWVPFLRVRRIVVVDEELACDEERKLALRVAVPPEIELLFFRPEEVAESKDHDRETLLIFSSPLGLLKAVERGLRVQRVNLGNLHFSEGKIVLKKTFCCSPSELSALKALRSQGIRLIYQPAPEIAPSELSLKDED